MGEWNRSTRKMTLDGIQQEYLNAINEHINDYDLKLDLSDYLMCIETMSSKKKKGLFGGGIPNQTTQVSIVTPKWLVIAAQRETPDSLGVLSIQLKDAIAKDYQDDPGYKLIPDSGINVSGTYTGRVGMNGNSQISSFIALGEELAAKEFKELLFETISNAKK